MYNRTQLKLKSCCEPDATLCRFTKAYYFCKRMGNRWTSSDLQICELDMLHPVYKFANRM